jgi:hypothetical protein
MTTLLPNHARCPKCQRSIGLYRDGTLYRHNDRTGMECAGTRHFDKAVLRVDKGHGQ